jgi:predicted acylesterase/phospholipase RssA
MTAILDSNEALCIEFDEIERRRRKAGVEPAPPADVVGETATVRATRLGLTALCLSGGGIRSAAFCLGVVQALAAKKLLNTFDYVSTVSGGGFIGGWLQMMLHEKGNVAEVEA